MNRRELKLSSAEKKAAKRGYEEEKRASVPYTRPSYAHYYPASDQSLTNIPAFSQRNWSVNHWLNLYMNDSTKYFYFHSEVILSGICTNQTCFKKRGWVIKQNYASLQAPSHTHRGETSGECPTSPVSISSHDAPPGVCRFYPRL